MENNRSSAEIESQHELEIEAKIEKALAKPEVAERYRGLFRNVYELLPENERESFLANPIDFISGQVLFRGMGRRKVAELLSEGKMLPESGDYSGTAVFATDGPVGAIDFVSKDGALAVIDPEKIDYLEQGKIYDAGSEELRRLEQARLASLPPKDRALASYAVADNWDTRSTYVPGRPWHTVALRREQPLAAVARLVTYKPGSEEPATLDPANTEDRAYLDSIFAPALQEN